MCRPELFGCPPSAQKRGTEDCYRACATTAYVLKYTWTMVSVGLMYTCRAVPDINNALVSI